MADTSTYELVITASDYSTLIGHHQFTCHVEETQSDGTVVHGTPEVRGIDYRALQSRFGGDILKWRDWVQADMLGKHQARMSVHKEILKWQGTRVAIAPPVKQPVPQPVSQSVPQSAPQWNRRQRRRRANRARSK